MVSVAGITITFANIEKGITALLIIVVGYIISRVVANLSERVVRKEINPHIAKVTRNFIFYTFMGIAIITAISLFIPITTVLAAAGIAGIAIGMAAQKSLSNMISGIFLLADQPFEIGDAVDIDGIGGVVLDVGLFSTRIRTFDNKYLRIPNDAVANAKIINLSRFRIRRLSIMVGIAYKEDIAKALEIIKKVLNENEKVLAYPEPQIIVKELAESAVNFEIRAWVDIRELWDAHTEIIRDIKKALDEAGIEIPFPHRTIYFGDGELERISKLK